MTTNTSKLLSGVSAKLEGALAWNRDLGICYYTILYLSEEKHVNIFI